MPLTIPEYIAIKTAVGAPAAYLSPEADGLKDVWIDQELNNRHTLTLSLPITSEKWQYLTDSYRIYAGGKEFIILNPDAIEKVRDGRKVWGKISAHESWVRLGKDYIDPGISNDPQNPTPPALAVIIVSGGSDLSGGLYTVGSAGHTLYAILQGTGWTVGTVDVTGTHDLETEKISALENINKIQEIWGGYLIWDSINKTVSLRNESTWAPYTGYQVRYGKNEKGITRTDDYDIVTKLYPFGEDDLNIGSVNGGVIYLADNSYTAEVLEGIWTNQDIADPQELKDEAIKYLSKVCKPRHNYKIRQVDLRTLPGYTHEDFDLGHMVDIIDSELGINIQARIIGYRYNVFQPWLCDLEIGDFIEKLESKIADSRAMVKYITDIRTSRNQITAYRLVDESLISQKIAKAAVDATKLDTKAVIVAGDTWTDNSPSSNYVAWNQHKLYYNGTEYVIVSGNTNLKYIYWDGSSNSYSTSATLPDLTDGQFYIAVNNAGVHDIVWNAAAARQFIGSLFIADAAILSAHIEQAQILDAHIAELTANKIKSGELYAYLVEIVGNNGYFRLSDNGFKAYDRNGALAGYLGWFETLADQIATFTRASVAYKQDGSLVDSGLPRYEYARMPAPVWQDLFDTDQLDKYTSGGDAAATWAVSGGVLTGTGGTQATLIKKDLLLEDVEIEVNCNQAQGGGIITRYQDNNNYYVLVLHDDTAVPSGGNLVIYKRVAGTFTLIVSVDVTWVRGVSHTIKFSCKGSVLEGYFDGVKVISVTDSSLSGGSVGLRQNNAVSSRFLDFKVYQATQAVTVEEGCTNIVASWPTGWTASGLTATDQGVQSGASGNTVRLTNSGGAEGVYYPPLFTLSPSTVYTIRIKYRGTVAADKFDVYVLSNTGTVIQSAGSPSSMTTAWQVYTATFTTTADITGTNQYIRFDHDGNDAGYIEIAEVELIQKAYALTFPSYGATRAAETMTVPTAGVFTKGNWAVELTFTPTSNQVITGRYGLLFHVYIDSNNSYYIAIGPTGQVYVVAQSGGINYVITDPAILTVGQTYSFMFTGNGSVIRFYKNGAQIGSDIAYTEPIGALPANMYIGSDWTGTQQANGLISNLRISSRARTLAEHQADYNTGQPLTADEYTTYLMTCNETLKPTIRKTGLMIKHTGTGDYTELTETGLTRHIAERIYTETPTGVPTIDNFESGSLSVDWEASIGATVQSIVKRSGTYALRLNESSYARRYVEITKDCTAEFYYRMDSAAKIFTVSIDGGITQITPAATGTWYQYTFSLTKGVHVVEFYLQPYSNDNPILYIDDITWEPSPVTYSVVSTNPGVYESEYLYEAYTGEVAMSFMSDVGETENFIPDIWIQLPDRFKGKTFTVTLAVKQALVTGGSIQFIKLHVVDGSMDYTNARFKVRARLKQYKYTYSPTYGSTEQVLYAGIHFTYVVVV